MDGGMHGMMDRSGAVVEEGWCSLGFPQAAAAEPGRTWEAISGG